MVEHEHYQHNWWITSSMWIKKKSDGKLFTADDYKKIGSLHNYRVGR